MFLPLLWRLMVILPLFFQLCDFAHAFWEGRHRLPLGLTPLEGSRLNKIKRKEKLFTILRKTKVALPYLLQILSPCCAQRPAPSVAAAGGSCTRRASGGVRQTPQRASSGTRHPPARSARGLQRWRALRRLRGLWGLWRERAAAAWHGMPAAAVCRPEDRGHGAGMRPASRPPCAAIDCSP